MISVHFQGKIIQYHSNPSLCPNHECQRSSSWMVLWWPTRPSTLTLKKKVLIITRDWNAKVGSQEIPKVTSKFGLGVQNEAGQRLMRILPRERTGHSKHPLMSTLEMTLHMDITKWSIVKSDWLYSLQSKMESPYIVNKNNTRSWLCLTSWTHCCQIQA